MNDINGKKIKIKDIVQDVDNYKYEVIKTNKNATFLLMDGFYGEDYTYIFICLQEHNKDKFKIKIIERNVSLKNLTIMDYLKNRNNK